jgi:hypothetical protein
MQGQLCSIGGHCAVAEILGVRVSGFPAWFLWRGIYLMKLPSFPQKMQVGLEWMCDILFPRTLAHLKPDRTRRIGRAHYAANDFVFAEEIRLPNFSSLRKARWKYFAITLMKLLTASPSSPPATSSANHRFWTAQSGITASGPGPN